ncbi:MAG TPA: SDR family NAD(P)-dependent oxidoreductase [Pyrinomonadaceae bacterium]|jgi:NAD(P)-dependent dehydrogenase (short-subunit alcohol dehydrogenase family)
MSKVWFITGAGRGMGVDIARAALDAGYNVVATGRNTDKVSQAIGESADLLVVKLDVTDPADAESAVKAAVDRFGRIDVLVNNAASFYAGFFEELTLEQMERQLSTSLIGAMNVTRAVLPVMRKQRSGQIISISSIAGLVASEFGSAYSASKFGLEGWMRSLQAEVESFGIDTIIVNPGFFRTELLTEESTNYAEPSIADYDERRAQQIEFYKGMNGRQPGDPAKLAQALITISSLENPPRRFIAGADAIGIAEQVVAELQQQINAFRDLSTSLAFDEIPADNAS